MATSQPAFQQVTTEELLLAFDKQLTADRQASASAGISNLLFKVYLVHRLRRHVIPTLLPFVLLGLAAGCIYYNDQARLSVMSHLRLAATYTLLPLADWLNLPEHFCFIQNPLHRPQFAISPEDCRNCATLDRVVHVRFGPFSQADFVRDFVETHQAAIIDPLAAGFPALYAAASPVNATPAQLASFYAALPPLSVNPADVVAMVAAGGVESQSSFAALATDGVCDLRHTLGVSRPEFTDAPRRLLRTAAEAIAGGKVSGWAASWRNCHQESVRAFRRTYLARPPCLPLSATLSHSHVLVWDSYPGHRPLFLPIRPEPNLLLLHQVSGTVKIELDPKDPCRGQCPSLQAVLRPGQMLVVSNWYYTVSWLPMTMGQGMAVAVDVETVNLY